MTRNQIDYLKHLETQRANKAQEALTGARDSETKRANLVSEAETHRANVAKEAENVRYHDASIGIEQAKLDENVRHNVETESVARYGEETKRLAHHENVRHNQEVEQESIRHNKEVETETHRSNLARETETHRSNVANESIGWANVSVAQINANTRIAELAESVRDNKARLAETKRDNKARLAETKRNNKAKLAEEKRSNKVDEKERKRHNEWTEYANNMNASNNTIKAIGSFISGAGK